MHRPKRTSLIASVLAAAVAVCAALGLFFYFRSTASPTPPEVAAKPPIYTLAATQSCLMALPNAVEGLPPATPPVPTRLFVFAVAGHAFPVSDAYGPQPNGELRVFWNGGGKYQSAGLSFYKSVSKARAALRYAVSWWGSGADGKLIRNTLGGWDQSLRKTVLGCLRSGPGVASVAKRPPPARLATFTGWWYRHDSGLSITSEGRGKEEVNGGAQIHLYQMTFQILSLKGTLTRATAVFRVTSFKRYERDIRRLHMGDVGELVLKNGVITNTLTDDSFCSDPAFSTIGGCGA